MSQNDFNLANQGFPAMRADMNSAFQALASNSAGTTEPSTTYAYQWWYDETTDILKIRNADDDAWINIASFDQTADEWELRSAVIQAVDSAGVVIKTDDGTTRVTIADSGNVTLANDLVVTGTMQSSNISATGSMASRNKIINGNFDIWQRGTSGSSGYVADRWTTALIGSTAAITQQAFTLGQTDVPGEPTFFHRVAVTSVAGAGNYAISIQRIEDVRTLAGQTATLSFWAKADAAKNIAVEFTQNFGTGGSPSASVTAIGVTTIALTTAWQKFTVTAAIPSISGKTLGTAGNDFLSVTLWLDAGSDFNARTNSLGQQSGTFDIAQVQLEAGDTATPFEHRSYGQELALCMRYFQFVGGQANSFPLWQSYYVSGNFAVWPMPFKAEMRASPTSTIVGTWQTVNLSSLVILYTNNQGFSIAGNVSSTAMVEVYPNSSDDRLTFSAEL
jgi:hypothetical protein